MVMVSLLSVQPTLVVCSTMAVLVLVVGGLSSWRGGSITTGGGYPVISSRSTADDYDNGNTRTGRMLEELRRNGTTACHDVSTRGFTLTEVPAQEQQAITAVAGAPLVLSLVSLGEDGSPRCAGGDFYETLLAGDRWRSRPRVADLLNGSYTITLLVDQAFPGAYNLTINLLFSNYHGLDLDAHEWSIKPWAAITQTLRLDFVQAEASPRPQTTLRECSSGDMLHGGVSVAGQWTRRWYNATCQAGPDGRFDGCVPADHGSCAEPWCYGRVAALESNGWAYSCPHCGFRLWERDAAWDCLAGKWLFFWGDSNMQDYVRNILIFVLDYPIPHWANVSTWSLSRKFDEFFVNPRRPDEVVRVSLVFNGHHDPRQNGLGLDSLLDSDYQDRLRAYFNGSSSSPSALILNAGLHDGKHFSSLSDFVGAIDRAVGFWNDTFRHHPPDHVVLRTSVTPAGASRYMNSNPHKMEVFNHALVDRLRALSSHLRIVDAFDPSFPFHFDHCCSDGGHYGRAPNANTWPWNGQPHQYFVDLMLSHMLLTSICPKPP